LVDGQDDVVGNSSLMWALAHGHRDVFDFLLGLGASVTPRNKAGMTCLHLACAQDVSATIVDSLLATDGVQAGIVDNSEMTALAYACMVGNLEIVHHLLEHDPRWFDLEGRSPLLCATKMAHAGVVEALLAVDSIPLAAINSTDETKRTSLHWAVSSFVSTLADIFLGRHE